MVFLFYGLIHRVRSHTRNGFASALRREGLKHTYQIVESYITGRKYG